MKKRYIIIGFIVLQVYLLMGIFLLVKWLPNDMKLDSMVVTESGNVYRAYSGEYNIWLIESDVTGKNGKIDICPVGGRDASILMSANGDNVYIFSYWLDRQEQYVAIYGKTADESSYHELTQVCLGEDGDVQFMDFGCTDAGVTAIGVEQNSQDIIELTYNNDKIQENRIKTPLHFVDISVCQQGFFGLDLWRKVYSCDENGVLSDMGIDNVALLECTQTGIFYQLLDDTVLHFENYEKSVHKEYRNQSFVQLIKTDSAQQYVAVTNWDDEILLMDKNGNMLTNFKQLDIEIGNIILRALPIWFLYTISVIAVLIVGILMVHCILLSKKMLIQVVSFLAFTSLIWIVIMLGFLIRYDRYVDQNEIREYLYLYSHTLIADFEKTLEEQGIRYDEAINDKNFLKSVFEGRIVDVWDTLPIREELIQDTGTGRQILYSQEDVRGLNIADSYLRLLEPELPEKFQINTYRETKLAINGKEYYVNFTAFGNEGSKLYLITRIPVQGINISEAGILHRFWFFAATWLVTALGFATAFYHVWKPVKLVNAQIDKMAKGDYSISNHGILDNEVGDIWISLEVLCKNLSFRDYKKSNTLDAVLQYAPMHFEKIFDRSKLQEVLVGESEKLHTTVGLISVIDKDILMGGKIQQTYLKYVNMLMDILVKQDDKEEVVLLQNDSNMEAVKIVFTGNMEDKNATAGVYYSISCMESILAKTRDMYEVNPFILLHTAEFNCGIAGGSGHAYPFVSGADMDVLATYVDQLRNCNLSMVVTEQTQRLLLNKYQTRYIGFVWGTDGETKLNLYEVLDACTEKMRKEKLMHNDFFQQGIGLFYEHEYSKARSCFIEYLKLCQDDGLAAWYLFACENGITKKEGHDDSSLFGARV